MMLRTPARTGNRPVKAPTAGMVLQSVPLAGWNKRDESVKLVPGMPPFAITLKNFHLKDGRMVLRQGSASHATGLNSSAKTLMAYKSGSTERLFAATDDSIYNVTGTGAVGAADVTGLSNGIWRWTMFSTTGGDFLMAANGADGLRTFDGSSWAKSTLTTLADAEVDSVAIHKERVWMVKKDTLDAYYLPIFAKDNGAGAETKFQIGGKVNHGGYLIAIGVWGRDAGENIDDLIVFVTSEGEVVIYSGIDPGSDFAHVATYKISKPVGKRCLAKLGGDLIILTEIGPVPVSRLSSMINIDDVISQVISPAFEDMIRPGKGYTGWTISDYSDRGWLIFNIPIVSDSQSEQFILHKTEQTWSKFFGWDAYDFAEIAGALYFAGTDTAVYQADTGTADGSDAIEGKVGLAWTDYGDVRLKNFHQVRAHFLASGEVKPTFNMAIDYDPDEIVGADETSLATSGEDWDVAEWDVAEWGGTASVVSDWFGIDGLGQVGSLQMAIKTTTQEIELAGFEVMYEVGAFQ